MKQIVCDVERCLGCRSCELACALEHSQSGRLVEAIREPVAPRPRIHVERIDDRGKLYPVRTLALQCRQCEEPFCVQACITGGMYKEETTGEVQIHTERCVGCWSCIMVCPYGAVIRHDGLHRAIKCDRCPGREVPACVEACPTHALIWREQSEVEAGGVLA